MANTEEYNLREVFVRVGDYLRYLLRKSPWIVLAMALGAALFVYRSWDAPTRYEGNLTFVVNEEEGGGGAGVGSILGRIGLGGSSSELNLAKIVKLGQSRLIIGDVLMDSVDIRGRKDLLGNHFIDAYGFNAEVENPADAFYFTHDSIAGFTRQENAVLLSIFNRIASSTGIMTVYFEETTGLVAFGLRTRDEELTVAILERIYENLSDFYITNATSVKRETYEQVKAKSDSLAQVLNAKEYELATLSNYARNLTDRRQTVRYDQLQREVSLLTGVYLETMKNREQAEYALNSNRPIFRLIDGPVMPLAATRPSRVRSAVIGMIFGAFISLSILFVLRFYRDIMETRNA